MNDTVRLKLMADLAEAQATLMIIEEKATRTRAARWLALVARPVVLRIVKQQREALTRLDEEPARHTKRAAPVDTALVSLHVLLVVVVLIRLFAGSALRTVPFANQIIPFVPLFVYIRETLKGNWGDALRWRAVPIWQICAGVVLGIVTMPAAVWFTIWFTRLVNMPLYLPEISVTAAQVISIGAVGPVIEELFFRGVLLNKYLEHWSPRRAIIINAVVFGLYHLHPAMFLGIVLQTALLTWWSYKTDSVIPAIAFHAANNLVSIWL